MPVRGSDFLSDVHWEPRRTDLARFQCERERARLQVGGWVVVWGRWLVGEVGRGVGGTPTQGGTPLEDGEQISFKVDWSIAASSLQSVHLKHTIK